MKTFIVATLCILVGLSLLYRLLNILDRRAGWRRAKETRDTGDESVFATAGGISQMYFGTVSMPARPAYGSVE